MNGHQLLSSASQSNIHSCNDACAVVVHDVPITPPPNLRYYIHSEGAPAAKAEALLPRA